MYRISPGAVGISSYQRCPRQSGGVEAGLYYEDFLRRRNLAPWPSLHPALIRLRELRISTLADFQEWVAWSRAETSAAYSEIAANGILSLLNLAILLLERQLAAQVRDFERNGGFSEHLGGLRKRALSGCR